jgi:serine/threonine protein kinase/Tfp pilus assembly protein PilF
MTPESLGHYQIIEKLSQGGWGTVYLAHDGRLERNVALKVLSAGTLADEDARKQFRREALTVAKLNHPSIAHIYDFDTQAGVDFLVMEYVSGGTLARCITERALSEKEVAEFGMQIAHALEEAHEHGIIHRDLKPANIAITPKGHVKVLDFGLAKLFDPSWGALKAQTLTQSVDHPHLAGTLPYMAPEQVSGEHMDARTDIYALGVVLYEMATRQRPFREDSTPRLFDSILHQRVVPPRALNPRTSPELERIILKCLEKDPGERYQSAKEIGVDLRRLLTPSATIVSSSIPVGNNKWKGWTPVVVGAALASLLAMALLFDIGGIRGRAGGHQSAPIRSIAVLPLENFSHDPSQEYFSDGMTDALITSLAQLGSVRVISRTSIMRYKKTDKSLPRIAQELNVDGVIEGSVMRSGNRIRIVAQLIQARTDQHLWAETYERDLGDVLKLQSEVAQAIAQQVRIQLTPEQQARLHSAPAVNPRAYEAYLKGRFYRPDFTQSSIREAKGYFEEAVQEDPAFAAAYAGLADCYLNLGAYRWIPPQDAYRLGSEAVHKALQLDDTLGDAHSTLGYLNWRYSWDSQAAEKELRRAVDLNPNYLEGHISLVWYLAWDGRRDEAVAEIHQILSLDPAYPFTSFDESGVYYHQRDYKSLIEASQKSITTNPNVWSGHHFLAVGYEGLGQLQQAVPEYQRAMDLSQRDSDPTAGLAHAYAALGNRAAAQKILGDLLRQSKTGYASAYMIAAIYSGLGQKDQAFEFLEKAYQERSPDLLYFIKADLRMDSLRSDPRFQDLLRRIGLPH